MLNYLTKYLDYKIVINLFLPLITICHKDIFWYFNENKKIILLVSIYIFILFLLSFQDKTTSIKIRELLENSNILRKRSSLDDTACLPSNFTTEKVPVFAIRSTRTKDRFTYFDSFSFYFVTILLFTSWIDYCRESNRCRFWRSNDVNSNQNWSFSLSFKSDRSTVLFAGLQFLTRSSEFDRTIDRF